MERVALHKNMNNVTQKSFEFRHYDIVGEKFYFRSNDLKVTRAGKSLIVKAILFQKGEETESFSSAHTSNF